MSDEAPKIENVAADPKPLEGVTVEAGTLKGVMERMMQSRAEEKKPEAKSEEAKAEPKAEPEKAEADDDDRVPGEGWSEEDGKKWALKRVARAKRQEAEALARADEMEAKLKQAQEMVDKLKAKTKKLDPADFESFEAYKAAKAEQEQPVEEPKPEARPDRVVDAAWLDIRQEVESVDEDLWSEAMERAKENKFFVSEPMVMWWAQHEDPTLVFRALFDAGEDVANEFAELTEAGNFAGQIRRLKQIVRDYRGKSKPEDKPAPPRDPTTGQFRKQSAAPEPINPVTGGTSGSRSYDAMSPDEYIRTRNAEQAGKMHGW